MRYEIEYKFAVKDLDRFREKINDLAPDIQKTVTHHDTYYRHPNRDFGATDEALRIRQIGAMRWITYKGPRFDSETKTRRELEFQLPDELPADPGFEQLLTILGFAPIASVRKRRQTAELVWQNRDCKIDIDDVDGLGTFVELESLASSGEIDEVRDALSELAELLGLHGGIRSSYMELILDQKSRNRGSQSFGVR